MWYICLVLSASLLVVAILLCIMPGKHRTHRLEYAFVSVVLSGFLVYLPQYIESKFNLFNAIMCDVLNLFQIITVNSNAFEDLQGGLPIGKLFMPYLVVRAVVHISLPFLVATVAVSFFVSNWRDLRIRFLRFGCKSIYVVTELNKKTKLLIEDTSRREKGKAAFLILKENGVSEKELNMSGKLLVEEKGLDSIVAMSAKKIKISYFCMTGYDSENIDQSLNIIRKYQEKREKVRSREIDNIRIRVLSRNHDLAEELIDARNDMGFRIRLVNEEQGYAYHLMEQFPLYKALDKNHDYLEVTVVGFTRLGEEVMKAALWNGQILTTRMKINLIVEDGQFERTKSYLRLAYPELQESYDINIFEADLNTERLLQIFDTECCSTNYIAICMESDEYNIRTALYLRKFFLREKFNFTYLPKMAVCVRNDDRQETVSMMLEKQKESNIFVFGNFSSLFKYAKFVNTDIDHLAKNIHFAYKLMYDNPNVSVEQLVNPDEMEKKYKKEIARQYKEALIDYYRRANTQKSNRAAALNIAYKLWQLGFELTEKESSFDDLKMAITEEKVINLRNAEHNRWMAFYRTEGWTTANYEEIQNNNYQQFAKGGRSDVLKMHPDICPFEEITEKSNLAGRKDMTDFDEKLIKILPAILSDTWQKNRKKKRVFYVTRRKDYDKA